MFTIVFGNLVGYYRIVSASRSGWKFQINATVVDFVNLNALYFLKLLNSALYLNSFCGLITEPLDEIFCFVNHLLLILVGSHLLGYAFLTQFDKFGIIYLIIVYFAARSFDCAVRDVVDKSCIMRNEQHSLGLGYKEILAWLDGETSYEEAVEILKRDTRHFAKRQITWFKRERDVIWINKDAFAYDEKKILEAMLLELKNRKIFPEERPECI